MNYIWIHQTPDSCTLVSDNKDVLHRRHAWVSPTFLHEGMYYRVRITATKEEHLFLDLDQAKDWAKAVVLLTQ